MVEKNLVFLQKVNDFIMSAVNAIYHIVINTHSREMTIPNLNSQQLYNYIAGIVRSNNCILYAINGIENHIHLLINLHPSIKLADLVREIKVGSNRWIKIHQASYPMFKGWGKEYGAFTYALRDRDMVKNYIERQREHHSNVTFESEYQKLLANAGIEWNEYRLT